MTIESFRRHTAQVYAIEIAFDDPNDAVEFSFAPGQFNMLYVPGVGEAAISIAGRSESGLIRHTIRSVGNVTQAIEVGGEAMSLGLRGPFGKGWPLTNPVDSPAPPTVHPLSEQDIVMVAGGIGLAPLRSMIEYIEAHRHAFGKIDVLVGARTPDDLLYRDEYDRWRTGDIGVDFIVDRCPMDWTGMVGIVTLLLERLPIARPSQTIVMTCGPEAMMRYVAETAVGRGISKGDIYMSLERNMNCAVGFCGHCQLGPAFVCKNGPVIGYHAVEELFRFRDL